MDIFSEIKVSIFTSFKNNQGEWSPGILPKTISLEKALTKNWQPNLTEEIKNEQDKSKRDLLKRKLACITPSAIVLGRRGKSSNFIHTGIIQFDIDKIDESELQNHIDIIRLIPHVLFLSLSASGKGLWGLIRISNPTRHSLHFNAIKASFELVGIKIDTAPRAVTSLRFLSFDKNAYFNNNALIFEKTLSDKPDFKSNRVINHSRQLSKNTGSGTDLIDWFNLNCNADDVSEILENFGFTFHSQSGANHRYTRPGKDVSAGLSVDFHEQKRTLYSFSSSVPGLQHWKKEKESGWSCSPVTALLLYGCGGKGKKHWHTAFDYIKDKM